MKRGVWKPAVIVAGLLLLLTYALRESRSPDLALPARLLEALRTFELHDAQLTRDVLLARAGLLPNYDSLAQAGENLKLDLGALQSQSQSASDVAARKLLGQHVRTLAAVTLRRLEIIEHFKSDNALLRNSLMYLTYAQAVLRAKLDQDPGVAQQLGHLSHSMLSFMQTPETSIGSEIHTVLDRLARATSNDTEFQLLVTHGRFVVDILPRVDALLRHIHGAPTPTQVRALQDGVWQYAARVEARAQRFRLLLYSVAVALLGYLLYQFLRLRATALQLSKSNAELNREMHERQQAEAALRASEERLRAIADSAKEAIISADSGGNLVSWNAGASAIFGYQAHEILGTPFTRLLPPRHHAAHQRAFSAWASAGRAAMPRDALEFTGARRGGSEFPLDVSLSSWSVGGERHVTAIMRDITQRKRLEQTAREQELQLIQANKMTALGTLVSGVAHEINNPNQLILLNARVLAEAWEDARGVLDQYRERNGEFTLGGLPYTEMRASMPTLIHDVHDGALRIERIINDLKDFARPRQAGHAQLQLNQSVQRAVRLLTHLIKQRTDSFRVALGEDVPPLCGDAQQVEQIAVNLIVNALEALPDKCKAVTVSTYFDAKQHCAVLQVRDEGIGIAQEHLARLCDPFFTTKQASGGTGLGLAITSSLVRAHNARIDFTSHLGQGTQVRVAFACTEQQVAAPSSLADSLDLTHTQ